MASSKVVTTNPDQPRDSSSLSSSNSLSTLFLHLSDSDLHHSNTATTTTMDDLLNSIYPTASTAAATSSKIVDDVWKEIVAGSSAAGTHPNGEGITLEDFLTKAGAVREEDVRGGGVPTTAATGTTTMVQFASSSVEAFGNNGVEAAATAVVGGKGKRRVVEENFDKATLQKQRRMIKNRESAARSRERKQAYTTELEHLVHQLEEENARLLSEEADKQQQRYKQLMECLIPIEERSEPKRRHRRTNSAQSV